VAGDLAGLEAGNQQHIVDQDIDGRRALDSVGRAHADAVTAGQNRRFQQDHGRAAEHHEAVEIAGPQRVIRRSDQRLLDCLPAGDNGERVVIGRDVNPAGTAAIGQAL